MNQLILTLTFLFLLAACAAPEQYQRTVRPSEYVFEITWNPHFQRAMINWVNRGDNDVFSRMPIEDMTFRSVDDAREAIELFEISQEVARKVDEKLNDWQPVDTVKVRR